MARRGWRTFRVAAGAILLLLTPAAPAFAQKPGAAEPDPTKSATQLLYNEGVAFAKKGEWEKAYQAFLSAWKLREHWQIAANLGRAELMTGRHVAAAEHLSFFLREAKDITGPDRAAVQKLLNEAKQRIATLTVKVNRPGAEVVIDGQVVGQAPVSRELYMDAGLHTVEARLGAESAEPVTVDIAAGQSRQVGLAFRNRIVVPESSPQAERDERKTTPAPGPRAGQGGGGGTREVVIWVGVGLTVVAAGAGAALGGMAFLKQSERNNMETCGLEYCDNDPALDEWEKYNNERILFRNAAIGSLAAAGLLGVGTLIYSFASSANAMAAPVQAGFAVTPGGAGVSLSGAW